MPEDWDENRVQKTLIDRAQAKGDTDLMGLLVETANLEKVPHRTIDGKVFVPASTTNAVYR